MMDLLAALSLVFFIEGLVFAAMPGSARRAMVTVIETPDAVLRAIGICSAVLGIILLWMVRG